MRRAPPRDPSPDAIPPGGIITETGFGICEDGAIGFADCVMQRAAPGGGYGGGGQFTMMASAPAPVASEVTTAAAEKPKSGGGGGGGAVLSNRDAQKYMGGRVPRSSSRRTAMPTTTLEGGYDDDADMKMCTCPDGGVPHYTSGMRSGYAEMMGGDYHCDSDDDELGMAGLASFGKSLAKHAKNAAHAAHGALKKAHESYRNSKQKKQKEEEEEEKPRSALHRVKKALGMQSAHAHMNSIVFEAMTGEPYSKEAARRHQVVDIFSTFPDGVPTHSGMSVGEIKHAATLSTLLDVAREGVAESVILGKHFSNHQLLHRIHNHIEKAHNDVKELQGRNSTRVKHNKEKNLRRREKEDEKTRADYHHMGVQWELDRLKNYNIHKLLSLRRVIKKDNDDGRHITGANELSEKIDETIHSHREDQKKLKHAKHASSDTHPHHAPEGVQQETPRKHYSSMVGHVVKHAHNDGH
jgi:hypothetical protein